MRLGTSAIRNTPGTLAGFQTAECDYLFLLGSSYRYMVLSVFLLPLILMSIIYVRIFLIISRHQRGRQLGHERSTLARGVINAAGPIGSAAAVNLPELISKSRNSSLEKCPVCSGNRMCRERGTLEELDDDYDDQVVSMLSEELSSRSMTSDGDDGDNDCKSAERRRSGPWTPPTSGAIGRQGRRASGSGKLDKTYEEARTGLGLLCDNGNRNQGHDTDEKSDDTNDDDESRQSRATIIEARGNQAELCDGVSSGAPAKRAGVAPSGRALVFVLDNSMGDRSDDEGELGGPVEAPKTIMKLKRVQKAADEPSSHEQRRKASDSSSSRCLSIAHQAGSSSQADDGPDVASDQTSSCRNNTESTGLKRQASRQQPARDKLRAKFSLSSRTTASTRAGETKPEQESLRDLNKTSSSRSSTTSRQRQQQRSAKAKHSNVANASSNNLENLLLTECTCDNKLKRRQNQRTSVKLARANTIGSDAQRTDGQGAGTGASAGADEGQQPWAPQEAIMSTMSGGTGSSISSGFATTSLKLQLRRSPTSPASQVVVAAATANGADGTNEANASGTLKNPVTATTATVASGTAAATTTTHSNATTTTSISTTVTRTNSNSLATPAGANGPAAVANSFWATGQADAAAATSTSKTINNANTSIASSAPSPALVPQHEPTRRHLHASAVPQTNTKALITTLLILGTYFVSYAPAIIYQVLTCIDHCPYPLYDISYGRRVLFGAMTTLLLIAKSIVDPLIYSYRMNEIQVAISRYLSKRRSKSSSHAASVHTSQRFTMGGGGGGGGAMGMVGGSYLNNSHFNQYHHGHHHHHHHQDQQSHSIRDKHQFNSSGTSSSFRKPSSGDVGCRGPLSGSSSPRATSQKALVAMRKSASRKLTRQTSSQSGLLKQSLALFPAASDGEETTMPINHSDSDPMARRTIAVGAGGRMPPPPPLPLPTQQQQSGAMGPAKVSKDGEESEIDARATIGARDSNSNNNPLIPECNGNTAQIQTRNDLGEQATDYTTKSSTVSEDKEPPSLVC